ncbi:hypothetical protein MSKOL_1618 [Methanosarcina sp. Kolksee]|uniref:hypothetical protein n=1 Tax=Methanosarcina sp. Kolksee TaxID=1434099 RepID=UPI000615D2B6|nr:hypothetical protein [Methanosarcina sp. Kolksee]AKB47395.1 hypothetical protein MSKOL_1618 [Methanosarcina sp. Kolksee]
MKKIISFLLFLLIPFTFCVSPAIAWEQTYEGHPYDASTDYFSYYSGTTQYYENSHVWQYGASGYIYITAPFFGYLSHFASFSTYETLNIKLYNGTTQLLSLTPPTLTGANTWHRIELIENYAGTGATLYVDGVAQASGAYSTTAQVTKIYIGTSTPSGVLRLDDFSTSSFCVGHQGFVSSADTTTYFTVATPNTSGVSYQARMTDADGICLDTWNLSAVRTVFNHNTSIFTNNGLYYINVLGSDNVLYYSKPIFYFSDGIYPESYFIAETDTAAEIRDENNNGGIISGGSSVYLYPDEKEDGYYNFTLDFSEPSYSRRVELTKIYNTTTLNGSILSYSGLTENYNVSRDSTQIGQTNGSDSWDNTVTWIGQDSYIYEFEPDYSLPGFWGYVKNSETQTAIKSATVSITNGTDTFYVYTDENGMYYQTQEIATGETYTVQAKKTNYETSNPYNLTTTAGATTRQDLYLSKASGSGIYYAPHDVGFTVLEYWYSGAGLPGVSYTISSEDDGEIKTGTTDSKGMFTGSDMTGGTNYTITLTYDGKTYTEHVDPSLTEYTFVLNKEGVLHQYANSWLTLSYTENTNNVTIAYESNKTITGASLTAIANNGTTVYSQTLTTDTGSFTFETGGEGDYTLNFHIQATDGDTASQSWGLSYPNKVPLFPDEYPAWLKNILFTGIIIVFLLSFGKAKNDIACGAVAILTSMGYLFEWVTCSFYFVVLVWIIALGAAFIHYKRTGGIG